MKRIIFYLTLIGLINCACGKVSNKKIESNASQCANIENGNKTDNALTFINEYVKNVNKMNKAIGVIEWVDSNKLSTIGFKKELKRIIDEAYKNEPEIGLDADPILDAQDNPEKGFVIESIDDKSNYLTVKGVDLPDFKLTIKIKNENGIWLVDGCGLINIPNEKRASR